jgi:hypothetical protein
VQQNISVVKSPVAEQTDPTFYWASGGTAPGYTSLARVVASQPTLTLGIPAPAVAPGVSTSGGVSTTNETRAYVYTWQSSYGEEGPPSPPTVVTGKIDATWAITMSAPTLANTTGRVLTNTNIYRTVTGATGVATYYFVAQVPIATLSYNDVLSDTVVTAAGTLISTNFLAPPTNLAGLAMMANGMLAGWVGSEIWFSEPYRPHAWPPQYQISTEYDIVAMVGSGQSLLIGTEGYPYFATGASPAAVTLARIPSAEPCISRGSMVGTQYGAFYASPNGLIFFSALGTVRNTTRETISKDKWQSLLTLTEMRSALLNGAYFVYDGVSSGAFQDTAFDNGGFQVTGSTSSAAGALIEVEEKRVGFTRLTPDVVVNNVHQDPWTGEVLIVDNNHVYWINLTSLSQETYSWTSKIFMLPYPANLGAMKFQYDPPPDGSLPSGIVSTYAWNNGQQPFLWQTRNIPASNQVFRLPSGFKADAYQFMVTGNLQIRAIQIGSTVKDLQGV